MPSRDLGGPAKPMPPPATKQTAPKKSCCGQTEHQPTMPSLPAMAWNLATASVELAADIVGRGPAGALVSQEEYVRRLTICDACDQRTNNRCAKCGCLLSIKARWRAFGCPLEKWGAVR